MFGFRSHTEPAAVDWVAAAAVVAADFDIVADPRGRNNCLHFAARHGDCCCSCHSAAAVGNCCFRTADFHIVGDHCCRLVGLRVEVAAIHFGVVEVVEEGWHHPVVVGAEANQPRQHSEAGEEDLPRVVAVRHCCLLPWVGMELREGLVAQLVCKPAFHRVRP